MIDADIAQLFSTKLVLALSSITKGSTPEQDKNASEAALNLLKALALLDKLSAVEIETDEEEPA